MAREKRKPVMLISVSDKEGIVDFGERLIGLGWRIVASEGSAQRLLGLDKQWASVAGAPRISGKAWTIKRLTGMGPVLGHRVVSLYPQIHGGVLATLKMRKELQGLGWKWIDGVCVDLYALAEAIGKARMQWLAEEISGEDALRVVCDAMDIGGPTLQRGGAKAAIEGRYVICGRDHRERLIAHLQDGRPNDLQFRIRLAKEALERFQEYDKPLIAFMEELLQADAFLAP